MSMATAIKWLLYLAGTAQILIVLFYCFQNGAAAAIALYPFAASSLGMLFGAGIIDAVQGINKGGDK